MTTIHFKGAGSIESEREWGGCNLIFHDGHLWRVANAVNRIHHIDVYAYRVGDELEAELLAEFETWDKKESA